MKKTGFTLSEIIIALSIIGIISAIVAPITNNLLPDKNKAVVLKVYKTLSELNEEFLNTPSYYWKTASNGCVGLACTQATLDNPTPAGAGKYPTLLQRHMHIDSTFTNTATTFKTIDGNVWTLGNPNDFAGGSIVLQVDIKDNDSSTIYSADNQKNIDTYQFRIYDNGKVMGEDALTKAYLKNPHKLNDRKADFDTAKGLLPAEE